MIIDFHTHVFPPSIAEKTLDKLAGVACCAPHTDGTPSGLIQSMKNNQVQYSVTLPAVTNPEKVIKVNDGVIASLEENIQNGLIGFGGMHPLFEGCREECKRLRRAGIKGIKLHPAYQEMDINTPEMLRVIDAACEEGLIVLTHAGIDIGLYDHNYSSVEQILDVILQVHPEKFVLAHMGNWANWETVESDLCGANVYFDTAFSIGKINPYPGAQKTPYHNSFLTDESFVRICKKHGTEKILFGTDSPWQDQGYYADLIQKLDFSLEEKENIFYNNAVSLLGL